jgi:Tol biopolymer transport system component
VTGWSPDGKWLSGFRIRGGTYLPGLLLYSLERRTFEQVTERGTKWVRLPDGSGFLFEDSGRIFHLDLATRKTREIGPANMNPDPDEQRVFAVSKDGRRLYIVGNASEADVWQLKLP